MKEFWHRQFPIITLVALWAGINIQFVWKMVYYPEPLIPVIIELIFLALITGISIWGIWSAK